MKKWLALVTALALLASFIPLHASAAGTDAALTGEPDVYELPAVSSETTAVDPTQEPVPDVTEPETEVPAEAVTEPVIDYPVITGFENLSNGVQITWDDYADNTVYRIYYRKAKAYTGTWQDKYGGLGWTRIATVRGNSYVHKGLQDAEVGIYTVRCLNDSGTAFTSGFYGEGWENCFYTPPQITSLHFDENGVHLRWNRSWQVHGDYNGESYRIYRKSATEGWTRMALTADDSFNDDTAVIGNVYTYTVRMVNEDGTRFLSGHNGGESIEFDAYPYVTKLENAANGVTLSWLRYPGAAAYRIYYRSPNGWTRIGQTTALSFNDTSAKSGELRYYTVRALNTNGAFVSDFKRDGWSARYHAAPVIASVGSTPDGVRITWNREEGAEDYRLYRRTTGSWQMLTQTDLSAYTDTDVVSGVKYAYTLRMVTADGKVFMSGVNGGKSITYVEAPVITKVTNTASGAKISWNASPGAYSYRVYYQNGASWTRIASTTLTECVDTTVFSEQTRVYTVRCVDKNNSFSSDFHRDGFVNTYYAPPVIRRLDAGNNSITVAWNRAKDAQDYRLYRKTAGTSWKMLTQTDQPTYTDTTAQPGVTYWYTLRMVTSDGRTFMSDVNGGMSSIIRETPEIISAVNGENSVTLRWNAVSGVSKYRVYYKNGASWTCFCVTDGLSCTDTAVRGDTDRVYTVRGVDFSGQFATGFNTDGFAHTYYAPPALLTVDFEDGCNVVRWTKHPDIAGYRVYRRLFGETGWKRIADFVEGDSFRDEESDENTVCTYTLRAMDDKRAFVSYFRGDNPYYTNGALTAGDILRNGSTLHFIDGFPADGYYTEDGALRFYRGGVPVTGGHYRTGFYQGSYTRAAWLYTLLQYTGAAPAVKMNDTPAVFALAKSRGIITSYRATDYYLPVTRLYAAQTIVNALGYPERSVGSVSDLDDTQGALSTLACYGYFIPDDDDRLYPYRPVSEEEFDVLISELALYQQLKGKTLITFGDSIMYGSGNSDCGIAKLIGEKYGMQIKDYSVPGALMGQFSPKSHIADQVRKAVAAGQRADLILINGDINDVFRQTGVGQTVDDPYIDVYDENTFSGGFEAALTLIGQQWKQTPVIYVRTHNNTRSDDAEERAYGERGVALAEKYRAAAVDLYTDSDLNTEIQSFADRYTYLEPIKGIHDGVHPNALGYARFYLPPLGEKIAAAVNG